MFALIVDLGSALCLWLGLWLGLSAFTIITTTVQFVSEIKEKAIKFNVS